MSNVKVEALRTFKGQPGEGLVRPRQVVEVSAARAEQLVQLGYAAKVEEKEDTRPAERETKTDDPDETKDFSAGAAGRSGASLELPEDFPGLSYLLKDGRYATTAAVRAASDEELDRVKGLGPATIEEIREVLA